MKQSKISESYLSRLLKCAIVYHDNTIENIGTIPVNFKSKPAAIKYFTEALRFEAQEAMRNSIASHTTNPLLHAVNLDTAYPGIVADNNHETGKIKIHTRLNKGCSRKTNNDIRRLAIRTENVMEKIARSEDNETRRQQERAQKKEQKEDAKRCKIYQKVAQAAADIAFRATAEKVIQEAPRGTKKEVRSSIREDRAQLKEIKQRAKAVEKHIVTEEKKRKQQKREATQLQKSETKKSIKQITQQVGGETPSVDTPAHTIDTIDPLTTGVDTTAILEVIEVMNEQSTDSTAVDPEYSVNDVTLFESPVAFNRHIGALHSCSPHPDILPTLLDGRVVRKDAIKMFHGPPGTGKTHHLILALKKLISQPGRLRCLVCAGSNVGTANLYTRAKAMGVCGSLIMKKDMIPSGTVTVPHESDKWDPTDSVVFCTVSTRSSYALRDQVFDAVLLDEAAQLQEACAWGLLRPEVSDLVMSGDPDQLPATVSAAGTLLHHDRSLMKRLMDMGVPAKLLDTQRRMHPDISAFSNKHFYGGKLKTNYTPCLLKTGLNPFDIIDVPKGKELKCGTSFSNRAEVDAVIDFVNTIKNSNQFQIVAISPYVAQCDALKSALPSRIEVHTVDSFQGREADIVVLTTVRTGINGKVGFWNDYRRLNVAMTRARHVLRVVGKVTTWQNATASALHKLASH